MVIRSIATCLTALVLAGCQHAQGPVPAVLVDDSDQNIEALKQALSEALNRAQIDFGAGDPTVTPSVSVLPPPPTSLEANSPVLPTRFSLFIRDGSCIAVQDGAEIEIPLDGVSCRAV